MRRSALVARRPVLCWEYPISRARAHTARREGSIGGSPLERMLRRATGRRRATRWTSSAIARLPPCVASSRGGNGVRTRTRAAVTAR